MPRVRSPKRGSRAFSPRKRAKDINGRVKFWPETTGDPHLLGFAGYKAGMTHVFVIEDRNRAPDFGAELKNAATVLDVPPMMIIGMRAYEKTYDGLKALSEAWMQDLPVDIYRTVKTHGEKAPEKTLKKMEKMLDHVAHLRVIAATQPRLASVSKKKPDIFEIALGGGSIEDQFDYAKGLLGETINVSDVFDAGESIDVIGVTKGKGFQGPVKRWGVGSYNANPGRPRGVSPPSDPGSRGGSCRGSQGRVRWAYITGWSITRGYCSWARTPNGSTPREGSRITAR